MDESKEHCPTCKKELPFCTCKTPNSEPSFPERKMFTLPRREFPKVMAGEGECKICGMPLKDSSCPMCGWTLGVETDENELTDEFRCPFCDLDMDSDGKCPSCGRGLDYLETEKEELTAAIQCSCPMCLKDIGLGDDVCPHCGARIWLDLEKELTVLDVTRCPKCQAEVSEELDDCPECGFNIWYDGGEGLEAAVLGIVESAEIKLAEGKKEGVRVEKLEAVLAKARKKHELGHYRTAEKIAQLVINAAKTRSLQYKMASDALKKAEKSYDEVGESADSSELLTLLNAAKRISESGKYQYAIRLAIRVRILAEKLKGQEPLTMMDEYK
jgi:hypothetical protein